MVYILLFVSFNFVMKFLNTEEFIRLFFFCIYFDKREEGGLSGVVSSLTRKRVTDREYL
jgi:hypothetical protein